MLAAQSRDNQEGAHLHVPVLVDAVCALLGKGGRPEILVDATVGTGGHALALLEAGAAQIVGLDLDERALAVAAARLGGFAGRVRLMKGNFAALGEALSGLGVDRVDGVLADLGLSTFALEDPSRGFSFRSDGPLDMRMDLQAEPSAYELVNFTREEELSEMLRRYGEEPAARRIARAIVAARRSGPLTATAQLRRVVERAGARGRMGRLHPATRTFQALRMAVNGELENLKLFLEQAPQRLKPRGRLVVIAYHSLEDRMVKTALRHLADSGDYELVGSAVVRPSASEVGCNRRARSAKLRCLERKAS
ncbi:MAG: 16S rRNA (cytosine(1402)-N(4))-methyltransferase RsmH [Deltaproteobacteria bacterium]|jgi:16S rRNA (cytosine1402-N4)-methyltransferase|nr:16S rRNA (cytosine(1402)-N(4))-methyltransferase RsmH [Deltaproteobacteria bacterium]